MAAKRSLLAFALGVATIMLMAQVRVTRGSVAPSFRSTAAKILLLGAGTGPSQVAVTQTTAPTCTASCGTSPSVAGSDTDMTVTMGSSGVPASGFVVTFNGTWAAAPACIATPGTTGTTKYVTSVVTTTTTATISTAVAPAVSDKYHLLCFGVS